jgi:hypothetical protein
MIMTQEQVIFKVQVQINKIQHFIRQASCVRIRR